MGHTLSSAAGSDDYAHVLHVQRLVALAVSAARPLKCSDMGAIFVHSPARVFVRVKEYLCCYRWRDQLGTPTIMKPNPLRLFAPKCRQLAASRVSVMVPYDFCFSLSVRGCELSRGAKVTWYFLSPPRTTRVLHDIPGEVHERCPCCRTTQTGSGR